MKNDNNFVVPEIYFGEWFTNIWYPVNPTFWKESECHHLYKYQLLNLIS
jgi:hypothetical protein